MKLFGEEIGITKDGVVAYSNGDTFLGGEQIHFRGGCNFGIKWQCVEFVRRWLFDVKNILLPDVDFAYQIWQKTFFLRKDGIGRTSVVQYPNKNSTIIEIGDILIWNSEYRNTGHVAVVVEIEKDPIVIKIAEQNFDNQVWDRSYSREFSVQNINGQFFIDSEHLLGWLRCSPE